VAVSGENWVLSVRIGVSTSPALIIIISIIILTYSSSIISW